ncbi:high frequency lysogenization protein HflD [Halomonas sp. BC04]|nr:high frequency lysogenization protein HflD [Halomonas sp. BC04]
MLAWQRDLHRTLTLALSEWSAAPSWSSGWWLMALSFGYGIFHAAGPGHGKAVLSTYLVSQGGGVKRALTLSFSAALLQGLMAIALVLVLVKGLGWLTRQAMGSVTSLELASFLMVALLGGWLCLRARRMLRHTHDDSAPARSPSHAHSQATPVMQGFQAAPSGMAHGHAAMAPAAFHFHASQDAPAPLQAHAAHDHGCGCGARHHVAPEETGDWRTALGAVVAVGMRPCSGAVLIMGAASLLGHTALGAAAVMTMALGTAITVSALALASVLARDWVSRHVVRYGDGRLARLSRLSGWLAMAGGLALVWLGLSLAWHATTLPATGLPLLS